MFIARARPNMRSSSGATPDPRHPCVFEPDSKGFVQKSAAMLRLCSLKAALRARLSSTLNRYRPFGRLRRTPSRITCGDGETKPPHQARREPSWKVQGLAK